MIVSVSFPIFILLEISLCYLAYDLGYFLGERKAYKNMSSRLSHYKNMSDRLRDDEDELK